MIFTPTQIDELKKVMDKYAITFIAHTIGTSTLTDAEKRVLTLAGFMASDFIDDNLNVAQAFKFGMLSGAIEQGIARKMNYTGFKKFLESGRFIPLNAVEKAALEALKLQATAGVRQQNAKMKADLEHKLVEIEKGKQAIHSQKVLDLAAEAIQDRKGVKQLRSELGKMSGQWNRDLGRMADYVLHDAFNTGRAAAIEKKGSRVYFDVFPGSCKFCIKLYLTAGVGSEPKIFTVTELKKNGSNVGLKSIDWKPTLGPIHPHCRCTVNEVPEGYMWDPDTRSFSKPKQVERKVQRRSKVKVTVDGKTEEV